MNVQQNVENEEAEMGDAEASYQEESENEMKGINEITHKQPHMNNEVLGRSVAPSRNAILKSRGKGRIPEGDRKIVDFA